MISNIIRIYIHCFVPFREDTVQRVINTQNLINRWVFFCLMWLICLSSLVFTSCYLFPGSMEEKKKVMSALHEACERAWEVNKHTANTKVKPENTRLSVSNSPFQVSPGCCIINNIIAWGYVDTGTDNTAFALEVKKEAKTEPNSRQQTDGLPYQI